MSQPLESASTDDNKTLGAPSNDSPSHPPSIATTTTTNSSGVSSDSARTPAEPLVLTARPLNSRVLVIRLNRPRVLNALSTSLVDLLLSALRNADAAIDIGAVVITGNDTVFAAGADIKELASLSFPGVFMGDYLRGVSEGISSFKKPIIAAVSGHALGGGLELALACDTIYAANTATFGLPEIKLGTIPGAGGTQRLFRAIGKAKAMNMILTGETMSSEEALSAGLIAKICTPDELLDTAIAAAEKMANFSAPILALAKEAALQADQLPLSEGLRYERSLYYSTFATADFREGMEAFLQKRSPVWKNA